MRGMIIGCGLLASFCSSALAQSVTGNTYSSVLCGDTTQELPTLNCDIQLVNHGVCLADPAGDIASLNDASALLRVGRAELFGLASASSHYFGYPAYGGAAEGSVQSDLSADDVVFIDTTNPTRTGAIQVSMNFILAANIGIEGLSNCNPGSPFSQAYFSVTAPGGQAAGSMSITNAGSLISDGYFTAYGNSGNPAPLSTPPGSANLLSRNGLSMHVLAHAGAMFCNTPPADLATGDSFVHLRLPCGSQVFNLPPGITVNSVELGIVNNTWGGLAITQQPFDAGTCPANKASFAVVLAGSGAIGYQWQIETANNVWANLGDAPVALDCGSAIATDANTPNLHVGITGCTGTGPSYHRVRCIASNDCNSVTSDPVFFTVCPADFDCSGFSDIDDFGAFVAAFEAGTDNADFDGSGFVDIDDFSEYVHAFEAGC